VWVWVFLWVCFCGVWSVCVRVCMLVFVCSVVFVCVGVSRIENEGAINV